MLKRTLVAVGLLAAAVTEDRTDEYLSSLPFSVEVVAPKVRFVTIHGDPSSFCSRNIAELLEEFLYLNGPDAPVDDGSNDDSSTTTTSLETPAPVEEQSAAGRSANPRLDNMLQHLPGAEEFYKAGGHAAGLFDFVDSLYDYLEAKKANTNGVKKTRSWNNAFNLLVPANFKSPQEKLRSFVTSLGLLSTGSARLGQIAALQSQIGVENRQRLVETLLTDGDEEGFIQHLANSIFSLKSTPSSVDELLQVLSSDVKFPDVRASLNPLNADTFPDQLVGFLSSRGFGNFFTTVFTGSIGAGINHDANTNSLGDGICAGVFAAQNLDVMPEWVSCALIGMLQWVVACMNSGSTYDCNAIEDTGQPMSVCDLIPQAASDWYALPSLMPINEAVDNTTRTLTGKALTTEGEAYWGTFYANARHNMACSQRSCALDPTDERFIWQLLPGWDLMHEVWLTQEGSSFTDPLPVKPLPFLSLSKRRNDPDVAPYETNMPAPTSKQIAARTAEKPAPGECEFMIASRGTASEWEWWVDIMTNMSPVPNLPLDWDMDTEFKNIPVREPPKIHTGYIQMGLPVMESYTAYLESHHFNVDPTDANYCDPNKTTLWFEGHSLGGGQTNVQSLLTALKYKKKYPSMQINAMAYASLRVFNEAAVKLHEKYVNSRNFRYQKDLVPSVPCVQVGEPRCNPHPFISVIPGEGQEEPVAENPGLVVLRSYEDYKLYDPDTQWWWDDDRFVWLPTENLITWAVLCPNDQYLNIPNSLQLSASHGGSYMCWTSSHFCSKDPANQSSCVLASSSPNNTNCQNDPVSAGGLFSGEAGKLASLNCEGPAEAKPYHTSLIPGLSGANICALVKSLM